MAADPTHMTKGPGCAQTLAAVKSQSWFYEFALPDGSTTDCYLAEPVRAIHRSRERALRGFIDTIGARGATALDVACHEGYFTKVLAERFERVTGIDKNGDSLAKAAQIMELYGIANATLRHGAMEDFGTEAAADFVLCFGLLYHVDNPVQVVRKLGRLARRAACIETQVLPFEVSGPVEDGSHMWQRELQGSFGLVRDYAHSKEGGLSDIAMVPSLAALTFLLHEAGFRSIVMYEPAESDYEQFRRKQRVILLAEK